MDPWLVFRYFITRSPSLYIPQKHQTANYVQLLLKTFPTYLSLCLFLTRLFELKRLPSRTASQMNIFASLKIFFCV